MQCPQQKPNRRTRQGSCSCAHILRAAASLVSAACCCFIISSELDLVVSTVHLVFIKKKVSALKIFLNSHSIYNTL